MLLKSNTHISMLISHKQDVRTDFVTDPTLPNIIKRLSSIHSNKPFLHIPNNGGIYVLSNKQ